MADTRIALVTGAAQGIGRACAEALREDGYEVILSDINADKLDETAQEIGAQAAIPCDMGDREQINAMFEQIAAEHGPVSALVNNAGVAMPGDFLSYSSDDFDRVIAINLKGVFLATQLAADAMVAVEIEGAIVSMSSINAQVAMSRTPLGRAGDTREIGDVIAFLCSKRASYITGETIYVDGGRLGLNYTC